MEPPRNLDKDINNITSILTRSNTHKNGKCKLNSVNLNNVLEALKRYHYTVETVETVKTVIGIEKTRVNVFISYLLAEVIGVDKKVAYKHLLGDGRNFTNDVATIISYFKDPPVVDKQTIKDTVGYYNGRLTNERNNEKKDGTPKCPLYIELATQLFKHIIDRIDMPPPASRSHSVVPATDLNRKRGLSESEVVAAEALASMSKRKPTGGAKKKTSVRSLTTLMKNTSLHKKKSK